MTLPAYYLPPVSWFHHALHQPPSPPTPSADAVLTLSQLENYPKQTLRNRCYIDSPNGPIALSIPVSKTNFDSQGKCLMRDVRISKQFNWQHQHWIAFESSYFKSPFFEFLMDDFRPFYERQWTFLLDFNEALIAKCFDLLGVCVTLTRGEQYVKTAEWPAHAAPKAPFPVAPYYQVFATKHGFSADLSIIDLLFNLGNEGLQYLHQSLLSPSM